MFEYFLMFLALCAFGRLGGRERYMIVEPAYTVITNPRARDHQWDRHRVAAIGTSKQ